MKLFTKALIATGFVGATSLAIATTVINPVDTVTTEKATTVVTAAQQTNQGVAVNQNAIAPVAQTVALTATGEPAINQNAISIQLVTVSKALTLRDDSYVQLKGRIVKALGDEKYQFRDATGTITVDIDDDLWMGKAISANTEVTIEGEVDIDYKPIKRVEIDVDAVHF